MLNAIVHHGVINDDIEYFAVVNGPDLDRRFFFEQNHQGRAPGVRYFGGGSELILTPEEARFSGNGGLFSEYMFGGQFPLQDLLNDDVVNRLVFFGGVYNPEKRELVFTPHTSGSETYESLFIHGNAVANYYFFIDDRGRGLSLAERQERTLRSVGKLLKRSPRVGRGNFLDLAQELRLNLGEPYSTLFMVRLVHRHNKRFHDVCTRSYASARSFDAIARLAIGPDGEHVAPYQRERIQVDVVYHHPENQQLIDEYKRVLAGSEGRIGSSERARLMRLRTLSLRNEVPLSIFDTLEEILLQDEATSGARLPTSEEQPYIQSTREILEGFLLGKTINKRLSAGDMVQLLENKLRAAEERNQAFEEILLDTGRLIDERALEDEDYERMESFSELITLYDRFDHTTTVINKLAFIDDIELSADQLRSLLGNMHVFEGLRRGLFQSLFIDPIMANQYTLGFGRRKLYTLVLGLISIDTNEASISDIVAEIHRTNQIERAYFALYNLARRRMSSFYLELNTPEGRETFRKEIADEVRRDVSLQELQEFFDDKLIEEVITKIRLEAFYINQLLPRIIDEQDGQLRTDFLANSGLDLFQVEELESDYFDLRAFPPQLLQAIRQAPDSSGSSGSLLPAGEG